MYAATLVIVPFFGGTGSPFSARSGFPCRVHRADRKVSNHVATCSSTGSTVWSARRSRRIVFADFLAYAGFLRRSAQDSNARYSSWIDVSADVITTYAGGSQK